VHNCNIPSTLGPGLWGLILKYFNEFVLEAKLKPHQISCYNTIWPVGTRTNRQIPKHLFTMATGGKGSCDVDIDQSVGSMVM